MPPLTFPARFRRFPTLLALAAAGSAVLGACAKSGSGDTFGSGLSSSSHGSGDSSSADSSGSSTPVIFGGDGGTFGSIPTEDAAADARPDGRARPMRCPEGGPCTCFNIASIGHRGVTGSSVAGMQDNTTEFVDWLNTESSTKVDLFETKPQLTPDFLANYDVIILQWLSDGTATSNWMFSPSEVSALSDWVNAGGGLITLSGFEESAAEVQPLNTLLSFSDISYDTADVLGTCPGALPCYCWGNSVPVGPWASGPIGDNITSIGAFHGRSIHPGSAVVDASGGDDAGKTAVYAAHEDVGAGHIFAWADEWVTYTSQWLGDPYAASDGGVAADAGNDPYTNPYDPCYMQSAAQVFQVPQFWFNAISYAAQATHCQFEIKNPTIVMPR